MELDAVQQVAAPPAVLHQQNASNELINIIQAQMDEMHEFSAPEIVFWFVCYGLIAFLAVCGNSLVVYVVLTRRKMQNVPNYFIVNLAIADAITGLIAVPFKFQAALLQEWTLPPFMCQLLTFTETLSLGVSVFTLTASAVDRFTVVMAPGACKMSKTGATVVLVTIWVLSIACSLPFGAFHKTVPFKNDIPILDPDQEIPSDAIWRCLPIHAEHDWWKWYNIYLTIIQYFVPLIIVDGAYFIIAYRVWLAEPDDGPRGSRKHTFHKDRRKVVKLLIIVVTLFTFCWLPYETYLLLSEVRPRINIFYYINVLFMTSHCLAMSNSCINPIIYGIYNKKFQREYRRVFYRCCAMLGRRQHRGSCSGATGGDKAHGGSQRSRMFGSRCASVASDMADLNAAGHNSAANFITSELGK